MKDLKLELMRLNKLTTDWPGLPTEKIKKFFVDDNKGFTVAEFKSEATALDYLSDCPKGYSVRVYAPKEQEYLDQCYENRRAWRYAHGMG